MLFICIVTNIQQFIRVFTFKTKIMRKLFLMILLNAVLCALQAQSTPPKRYLKTPTGYLMVLQQGDDLFKELEKLATIENIPFASFTGFGFVNIKFGYFDFSKKEYKPKEFKNVELASMQGSMAWQNQKPSIHAHGVVGDEDFKTAAGHILSATVSTGTLEIVITAYPKQLQRKKDEKLGANVLDLE